MKRIIVVINNKIQLKTFGSVERIMLTLIFE